MLILVGLAVATLVFILVGSRWATSLAQEEADQITAQEAETHRGLLVSELQKFRLLPLVLAEFPDVATVLGSRNAAAERRLNEQLELLADRTDAAAIYLLDNSGVTRVASNWRLPTSFVGQNYGFRPYFKNAMRTGESELFALGTVSGRPGLYLARRVNRGSQALGTIIVKVEFDKVEADWARNDGISFVTDLRGVILITSVPAWRFTATAPMEAAALADLRRTLQFGPNSLRNAPVNLDGKAATIKVGRLTRHYRVATFSAPLKGGRLYHLFPLEEPLAAARREALLWALGALMLIGGSGAMAMRQRDKQRFLRESREALQLEVARQTTELRNANERLTQESYEREEATAKFLAARDDLARASRLGTLGQITAGVAHEINQPIAAIRTFAENCSALIKRNRMPAALENLGRIVSLTERIGFITAELRSFTRRKTPTPVQAELGSILDGSMLLLGADARGKVTIRASAAQRRRVLFGDRIRLEQVLINLIRNALDAVVGTPDPRVNVSVLDHEGDLRIQVSDNGPGVDPAIRETLFAPFESAKPGGLGLGLAIARDIAREFDGDLTLESGMTPGATFHLTLRIA